MGMIFDYFVLPSVAGWLIFIILMRLASKREKGGLSFVEKFYGASLLFIGYINDVYSNWTLFSILLLEFPRELTVTARLRRIIRTEGGWRLKVALFIEEHFIDPYDKGHLR